MSRRATDKSEVAVPRVGRLVQERMAALGWDVSTAAQHLNTHRTYLLKLINGNRQVGTVMAFRFAEVFGGSPEDWLIIKIRAECADYRRFLASKKGSVSDDRTD